MRLPTPRYVIKEEGRRLVTIDTATGQRIGLAAQPQGKQLVAARTEVAFSRPERPSNIAPARKQSAKAPVPVLTPAGSGRSDDGRAGRLLAVIAVGTCAAIFLILTYLWIFVAIAMAIAPVRRWVITKLRTAIVRYVKGRG